MPVLAGNGFGIASMCPGKIARRQTSTHSPPFHACTANQTTESKIRFTSAK